MGRDDSDRGADNAQPRKASFIRGLEIPHPSNQGMDPPRIINKIKLSTHRETHGNPRTGRILRRGRPERGVVALGYGHRIDDFRDCPARDAAARFCTPGRL
jgi:hypothetical protein